MEQFSLADAPIHIIANPIAGGGQAAAAGQDLSERLCIAGRTVHLHFTENRNHLRQLAASLSAGCLVVSVGGDGTLSELLDSLANPAETPLLQLPFGTANMLARELQLPTTPVDAVQLLQKPMLRSVDFGVLHPLGQKRSTSRRFLQVASAGFDAMVTEEVRRTRGSTLGFRGYMLPLLRSLRSYRYTRLTVSLDGETPFHAALAVVSNLRNYGGIFSLTDRAVIDDGLLDVCGLHFRSPWRLVSYAWSAWRGRVSSRSDVHYRTASAVTIKADQEVPVQVDGDAYCSTPVRIEVQPQGALLIAQTS